MHKGSIRVVSEKNKGAVFYIQLPLGNAHFSEAELVVIPSGGYVSQVPSWIESYVLQDSRPLPASGENMVTLESNPYTVLIVEDSSDLRGFLQSRLTIDYNIVVNDGREGI